MVRLLSVVPSARLTLAVALLAASTTVGLASSGTAAALDPSEEICFPVSGRSGDAAIVNLTPVRAQTRGFGLLLPAGADLVEGSNVNFGPGTVDPNVAVTQIGDGGEVCFHNSQQGAVELLADHLGSIKDQYYQGATSTGAPQRLVDTRSGLGGSRLEASEALCFAVAGEPGDAAIVNLTPVRATTAGFGLLVSSDAPAGPVTSSNVNFDVDVFDPNLGVATIGQDGQVCFRNSDQGPVDLVADHLGTIAQDAYTPATTTGTPLRLADTRRGVGGSTLEPSGKLCLPVEGSPGDGVLVNLTPVKAQSRGFGLLLTSDVATAPEASNVNFDSGTIDPNLALALIGADGEVCFHNSDQGPVDLIADLVGTLDDGTFIPATEIGAPDREVDTRSDFVARAGCDGSSSLDYDVATSQSMLGLASQAYEIDPGDPLGQRLDTYGSDLAYADELSCWELVAALRDGVEGLGFVTDTEVIVARNPQTGDLAVAYRGTEGDLLDIATDANVVRQSWTLPNGDVVESSVHSGFLAGYLSIRDQLRSVILANTAAGTPGARVYFTGHSLGGALATLATLGYHNDLVDAGYDIDEIVTYTFAAPRSISRELSGLHADYAPQTYAVATPFDPVPQVPTAIGDNHYSHVEKMVLLHVDDDGGSSRIDTGDGRNHRGCTGTLPSVFTFATYHPRAYYNAAVAAQTTNKPTVSISISDVVQAPGTNNIGGTNRLEWSTPTEGPCDDVGLFRTSGTLTSAANPIRTRSVWLDTNDQHTTTVGKGKDYWIGYIDQFGELEVAKEYIPTTPSVSLLRVDRSFPFNDDIQFSWSVSDPGSRDLIVLFDSDPNDVGPDGYYRSVVGRVEAEASTNSPETTLVNVGSDANDWWVAYIMIDDDGTQTILATSRGVRG